MTVYSEQEKIHISAVTMKILDRWGVTDKDKVKLLGLPAEIRPPSLGKYRDGTPFPDDPVIWERLQHFAGIDDSLRTSYPPNQNMASIWIQRKHSRFGGRTPLVCMLEDGLIGISAIHMHLDCSYDWQSIRNRLRPARRAGVTALHVGRVSVAAQNFSTPVYFPCDGG